MKSHRIINDPQKRWDCQKVDSATYYYKGYCWLSGKAQSLDGVISYISSALAGGASGEKLAESLENLLTGHFSLIVDTPGFCLAFVDKIRSWPLFYSSVNREFILSNSANRIAEHCHSESLTLNKDNFLAFQMAGYTFGRHTLLDQIQQILPGEWLLLRKDGYQITRHRYYQFWNRNDLVQTEEAYFRDLDGIFNNVFKELIESLNGAPVVIPLSGGLDSRLILALLKEFEYKNITTYTYGVRGLWEIECARVIADYFGVDWHYIEFDRRETRKLYHTRDREMFFHYSAELNSIASLQDYYSILFLREKNLICSGSVFINGQTGDYLTGGHIPSIVQTRQALTTGDLNRSILDKHYSLWVNLKTDRNCEVISRNISEALGIEFSNHELEKHEFAKLFELFEWEQRQSKYVVNGQRGYDWFGIDWRLPLWADELMFYWEKIPWQQKIGQNLFKNYLTNRNFGKVFNRELPPRYNFQPWPIWSTRKLLAAVHLATGIKTKHIADKYTRFFMHYAPLYPQHSYREYLKDSKWHRNPISYWVNDYLGSLNEK